MPPIPLVVPKQSVSTLPSPVTVGSPAAAAARALASGSPDPGQPGQSSPGGVRAGCAVNKPQYDPLMCGLVLSAVTVGVIGLGVAVATFFQGNNANSQDPNSQDPNSGTQPDQPASDQSIQQPDPLPSSMCRTIKLSNPLNWTGLTLTAVQTIAQKQCRPCRVVRIDGFFYATATDVSATRANLTIAITAQPLVAWTQESALAFAKSNPESCRVTAVTMG